MLPRRGTQSDPSAQGGLRRPAGKEPRENATRAPLSRTRLGRDGPEQDRWAENKDEGVTEPVAGTPMARSTPTAGTRTRSKRGGPAPGGTRECFEAHSSPKPGDRMEGQPKGWVPGTHESQWQKKTTTTNLPARGPRQIGKRRGDQTGMAHSFLHQSGDTRSRAPYKK